MLNKGIEVNVSGINSDSSRDGRIYMMFANNVGIRYGKDGACSVERLQ